MSIIKNAEATPEPAPDRMLDRVFHDGHRQPVPGEPGQPVTEMPAMPYLTEAAAGFWLVAHQVSQRSEHERLKNIQAGFPPGWIRAVREAFKLSNERLEALFNASASTLERRQRQQQPLDPVASERLDRVAVIATHAMHVLATPEHACSWMTSSNAALGDRIPLHLCETEIGARQVRRVLASLQYGGGV